MVYLRLLERSHYHKVRDTLQVINQPNIRVTIIVWKMPGFSHIESIIIYRTGHAGVHHEIGTVWKDRRRKGGDNR